MRIGNISEGTIEVAMKALKWLMNKTIIKLCITNRSA